MRHEDSAFVLSATDLAAFLACRHRTALDMGAATGAVQKPPYRHDSLLELLWQRGIDHEKRYVESLRADGRTVTDLRDAGDANARVAATLETYINLVGHTLTFANWSGPTDPMIPAPR